MKQFKMAQNKTQSISIVIPLYNGASWIEKCLKSVLNAYPKNKEIIVVDNNSFDNGPEIVRTFKQIKLIHQPIQGPPAARNLGIENSTGDIVICVDQDLEVDKNCFLELSNCLSLEKKVAVAGGVGHSICKDFISLSHEVRLMGYSPMIQEKQEVKCAPTMIVAFLRSVLNEVGYFNKDFLMAEDYDICTRVIKKGYKVVINPKAIVYHYHPTNLRDLSRKWFKYGYWWYIVNNKHKNFQEIFPSIAWLMLLVIFIIFIFIDSIYSIFFIIVFILPWIVYYLFPTLKYFIRTKNSWVVLFPLVHQIIILARSIGIFYGFIKRR